MAQEAKPLDYLIAGIIMAAVGGLLWDWTEEAYHASDFINGSNLLKATILSVGVGGAFLGRGLIR